MPKRTLLRTIKDPFRDSADDPIEMEVLFRALSKIGLGEGLLPGAKAQGLGRILGDGISLDDVEFPFRYGSAGVAFKVLLMAVQTTLHLSMA